MGVAIPQFVINGMPPNCPQWDWASNIGHVRVTVQRVLYFSFRHCRLQLSSQSCSDPGRKIIWYATSSSTTCIHRGGLEWNPSQSPNRVYVCNYIHDFASWHFHPTKTVANLNVITGTQFGEVWAWSCYEFVGGQPGDSLIGSHIGIRKERSLHEENFHKVPMRCPKMRLVSPFTGARIDWQSTGCQVGKG